MTEQETKKEIRVYAIDIDSLSKELDGKRMKDITKEEFMAESEKQGLVYTLEKFEEAIDILEKIVIGEPIESELTEKFNAEIAFGEKVSREGREGLILENETGK